MFIKFIKSKNLDLVFRGPAGIPNQRNLTTMLAFFSIIYYNYNKYK